MVNSPPLRRPATPEESAALFWRLVDRGADDECWNWLGATDGTKGYGRLRRQGRTMPAHRFAYELAHGPIPAGLTIDHLCRNHGCVNPAHLEAVTNRQNILRGDGPTAVNARATHCLRGHPFDLLNTLYVGRGRECRTCRRERARGGQA